MLISLSRRVAWARQADDLTRQVMAEVAGVELVENETALAHIQALFARRNREMPERNLVQRAVPQR